ncbi:ATP-binding cassette domain-containing protein [Candidatus Aquiluna sp. IMCC13023]|uniref:ABC transporter ATP-binding protein n=1 Tax=Candidatus Aquiluna sp. IMCC13023 TaxID=1081644 RepID=UPI0002DFEDAF|nr:ATP-binding cassette domain-containing protein [Candidatus Aquiluna sp. IMCC13023]
MEPVIALQNINLTLSQGDRLGILGLNGSGKTTLLRLISGVYPPTRGGRDVTGEISSLLDLGSHLNGRSTGREYILFRSRLMGRPKALAMATLQDAIEFGGLSAFIDEPIDSYNSGMRMKLLFCLATAVPPEILVMDEWLGVGDQDFETLAKQRLSSFVNGAKILVLASHSKRLLEDSCNRFLLMEGGGAREVASLDEYFENNR